VVLSPTDEAKNYIKYLPVHDRHDNIYTQGITTLWSLQGSLAFAERRHLTSPLPSQVCRFDMNTPPSICLKAWRSHWPAFGVVLPAVQPLAALAVLEEVERIGVDLSWWPCRSLLADQLHRLQRS